MTSDERRREQHRRYNASAAGRARRRRYAKTAKAKAVTRRYRRSEKGRAKDLRYRLTPKGRLRIFRYADRRDPATEAAKANAIRAARRHYLVENWQETPTRRTEIARVARVVVLSDLQMPFEDVAAVDQALAVTHRVKPDLVILNGDVIDCYLESVFTPRRPFKELEEIYPQTVKRMLRFLGALRDLAPRRIWLFGNHEDRWARQIGRERAFGAISPITRALIAGRAPDVNLDDPTGSFATALGVADQFEAVFPWYHRLYLAEKNLVVTHGQWAHRHSGHTAKRALEWAGRSVIIGHTHRLGTHFSTQDDRIHAAWENGCLCGLEPEYAFSPNWQQGFSVVHIDGPEFHVIQVPIVQRAGQHVAVYREDTTRRR